MRGRASRPGVSSVPISWRAAARAYSLPNFERRDPGDRLLIATALELGCPLVTYDGPITDRAIALQNRPSNLLR